MEVQATHTDAVFAADEPTSTGFEDPHEHTPDVHTPSTAQSESDKQSIQIDQDCACGTVG